MILFLATGNAHKVTEFGDLLGDRGKAFELRSAKSLGGMPAVEETGGSFAENACIKARALLPALPDGAAALADDSGLEVEALGGGPGVYSARFAGPGADSLANNAKLLEALAGVPEGQRGARFVCVLALLQKGQPERLYRGECKGRILFSAKGEEGFGYDPLFAPEGYDMSFAELGEAIKHKLSHRARAVNSFMAAISP